MDKEYFNSVGNIVSVYQLDLGAKWHFETSGALESAILQGNISLEQLNNLVNMKKLTKSRGNEHAPKT